MWGESLRGSYTGRPRTLTYQCLCSLGGPNATKQSCPQLATGTLCIFYSSRHPSVDIRLEAAWDLESFLSPKKPVLTFGISGVSHFFLGFSSPPCLPTPPLSYTELHLYQTSPPYFPSLRRVMNPASSHTFPVFLLELLTLNQFPYTTVFLGKHPFFFFLLLLCSNSQHIVLSTCTHNTVQYRLSIHIFPRPHCPVRSGTFSLALLEPLKGKQL